jgi:hypothetical protein
MPKTITVKINPDGTQECVPIVTRVRPGDSLVWAGKKHTGMFEGKIPGPPRDSFTLADLAALKPVPGAMPFNPLAWSIVDETPGAQNANTVHVDANAESGVMYKYSVNVGGKIVDPIIIVDDSA